MRIAKLIQNNEVLNQSGTLTAFDNFSGNRFIKAGWKTQAQFDLENAEALRCNAPQVEKGESRIFELSPEKEEIFEAWEILTEEERTRWQNETGFTVSSKEIEGKLQYFYTRPAVTETQYLCASNYEIVIEDTESLEYKLEHYRELRAPLYPPMANYLDAIVKQTSNDPAIVAEGEQQEAEYCEACLAVKEQYPKA